MLRRLGRTIGSLVLGLLTSAVMFLGTLVIAERVLAPVRLPSGVEVFTNMWDYGVVSASGTWTIEGYGHGTPLNHVKISCHREDKTCVMAQATVDSNTMSADIYNHAIEKWDASTITYKTDAGCTNYVYTIDRANKRVPERRLRSIAPSWPGGDGRNLPLPVDRACALVGLRLRHDLEGVAQASLITAALASTRGSALRNSITDDNRRDRGPAA
jgi:hypothetical protein